MRTVLVFLVSFSAVISALSFSSYAFLYPQVPQPLGLGSCAAFSKNVFLSGKAVQESGFEQGVLHAQDSLKLLDSARRLARFQDTPMFWGGSNTVLYALASLFCHRLAAQALAEAVTAVNSNWGAVDRCVASLEYGGVQLEGASRGLFLELDAEREKIETRKNGAGIGGRLVEAFAAIDAAARDDAAFVRGIEALVASGGVLERQVGVCRDVKRVIAQAERDVAGLEDEVDQRLQEGQRLGAMLESEKISLVPQYAFSLQKQASFARSGWVQSFPEALQTARQAGIDAQEEQRKGRNQWKQKDSGFVERTLFYLHKAREEAERSFATWHALDQKTQSLESDLLRQVDTLRLDAKGWQHNKAAPIDAAIAMQSALELSERPLPQTRGELILQLADAVRALAAAKESASKPADIPSVRRDVDKLALLLSAAERDGLDVSFERSKLSKLRELDASVLPAQVADQLVGLRESVLEKAKARFDRLDESFSSLSPFRSHVFLPDLALPLVVESNIGQLSAMEKQLADIRERVEKDSLRWLTDYLDSRLELKFSGEPVVADETARLAFSLSVENGLAFGSQGPVLLKRPSELAQGSALLPDSVFRLLSDGLLLEEVEAGGLYRADGVVDEVLVRTKSIKEETRYASSSVVRRVWRVVLDSQISGAVFWRRPLGHPVENAVLDSGQVSLDSGEVRVVLPHAKTGVNSFVLEFDVPQPVRVGKTSSSSQWLYELESRVPFDLNFPWVFEEAAACVPESRDLAVIALPAGLYRFSANVTLHAFERRKFYVQIGCVVESLQNQSVFLSKLPAFAAGSGIVLEAAQKALDSGRLSEAAWLLSQVQQPQILADPLEKYRGLPKNEPRVQKLLERADAAFNRGDSTTLEAILKELEAYFKAQTSALEEQVKAICARCPPQVQNALHQVKSALFLGDLADARLKLSDAQQQYAEWVADEEEKNQTVRELADRIQAQSWPALKRFESEWAVSEPAVRWRSRQPLYLQTKERAEALQAAVKKLQDAAKKALDGKAFPVPSVNASFVSAESDNAALEAMLDRLDADSRASFGTAQEAFQQFGTPALEPALDAVRQSFLEGRFAAALYASEQLILQLQRAPQASSSAATGFLGSRSLLEVGAGVGGLVVLGGLAYWFKLRKKEPPLEEIG